ncbi:nucleotidyltransferase domain-containing protein [Kitasatospora atroaurantiaca]|uniref:Nucleotidyltransferase-like protein n=1 Tax=Kitasatospora atroaurantiaca TaxID=285545 RepID=A0A561EL91_9ACTN|nr:nucleotidyltransferase domain-containing protein [Kitasatospora atroaurantiaca]TWE16386.1 nucleotidyltransferase-like protein [Kitasatospora atroaurantiaca]
MTDEATSRLLDRFISDLRPVLPLVAVWAHGSLAGGDYQPGRSDLDLIAVLDRPCTAAEEQRLEQVHESLGSTVPLASKLHCSYPVAGEVQDPAQSHLTWAHEELTSRPVTPVTRRELHEFGLVLYGEAPIALLPRVTDRQLAEFVVKDLEGFWRPSLDHPEWWDRDVWVDLGLLTLARATVTMQDGRLITKAEALDVLTQLGAPAEVVDDIRQRRYGAPGPASPQWIARRAELALTFLRLAIEQVVTDGTDVSSPTARPAPGRSRGA